MIAQRSVVTKNYSSVPGAVQRPACYTLIEPGKVI